MEPIYYLIAAYLLLVNLAGFLLFGIDKQKAKKKKWRIPERTLFGAALLGGSVGCLLGMKVFRHKTKHRSFTIGIPAILIIELSIVFYILFRFDVL